MHWRQLCSSAPSNRQKRCPRHSRLKCIVAWLCMLIAFNTSATKINKLSLLKVKQKPFFQNAMKGLCCFSSFQGDFQQEQQKPGLQGVGEQYICCLGGFGTKLFLHMHHGEGSEGRTGAWCPWGQPFKAAGAGLGDSLAGWELSAGRAGVPAKAQCKSLGAEPFQAACDVRFLRSAPRKALCWGRPRPQVQTDRHRCWVTLSGPLKLAAEPDLSEVSNSSCGMQGCGEQMPRVTGGWFSAAARRDTDMPQA